jgi:hypothetical protein
MTDAEVVEEGIPDEGQEPGHEDVEQYPDTTVGSLMRQRDEARGSARTAQRLADQYVKMAADNNARAEGLSAAIIALGGEPEGA